MAEDTPAHRTAHAQRSGDTHEIGADGIARNLDQEARDKAAEAAAAESAPAPPPVASTRRGAPDPLPPVQLTDPTSSDA